MSIAALIRSMAVAGASPEAIALAVEAIEAVQDADKERRAKQAERKARQRERDKSATVTGQSQDTDGTTLSPKERSPTPPKEITPIPPVSEAKASSTGSAREFAEFWSIFPNKVGKRDAETAFVKARRRAPFPAILAGVERYAAKTDDRPWCNPATFLNQGRWDDQPADRPMQRGGAPPKPLTLGEMFREDARQNGFLHDQPPANSSGRVEARDGSGEVTGAGDARVIALTRNLLGGFG